MQTNVGRFARPFSVLLGASLALAPTQTLAQALPHLVHSGGKHALIVDDAPFLMLGVQANNSSNYPAMLPKVWPIVGELHANTLEIPVAWEQIEPIEGKFGFSWVDTLVREARANNVRLVPLWFGTWKNTNPQYAPEWVKRDTKRFPRETKPDGTSHWVMSAHGRQTLEADKRAFTALMRHIVEADPQHTIIMVQVENETGSYGIPRDFSVEAQRLFAQPIPAELARRWLALGNGTIGWSPFGMDATGYFNFPLGAKQLDAETLGAFESKFGLIAPIARDWAKLAYEHSTAGFAKPDDASDQSAVLGRWKINASYGFWQFGLEEWAKSRTSPNKELPVGGAALIQLGPDEFLIAGSDIRLRFSLDKPSAGENSQFLDVEEGTFVNGQWQMTRRWNGDQVDYGLNLTSPTLLKVRLGTYR